MVAIDKHSSLLCLRIIDKKCLNIDSRCCFGTTTFSVKAFSKMKLSITAKSSLCYALSRHLAIVLSVVIPIVIVLNVVKLLLSSHSRCFEVFLAFKLKRLSFRRRHDIQHNDIQHNDT